MTLAARIPAAPRSRWVCGDPAVSGIVDIRDSPSVFPTFTTRSSPPNASTMNYYGVSPGTVMVCQRRSLGLHTGFLAGLLTRPLRRTARCGNPKVTSQFSLKRSLNAMNSWHTNKFRRCENSSCSERRFRLVDICKRTTVFWSVRDFQDGCSLAIDAASSTNKRSLWTVPFAP